MSRRVVVTGGSVVSALGNEWPVIFASLKEKNNKIKYILQGPVNTGKL